MVSHGYHDGGGDDHDGGDGGGELTIAIHLHRIRVNAKSTSPCTISC